MHVWAVSNQKGGVGKTSTVANLGGLLAQRGSTVLLIDLDPHGSLTSYFGFNPETVETGVYHLFRDAIARRRSDPLDLIRATDIRQLDLMPAVMALATVERQAGAIEGLGLVIQQALKQINQHYDYVLIDSPPMLGVLMVNALAACDRLLIPLMADFLSLRGLERMLKTLAMINRSRQQPLPYLIVPTLFDRRPRISRDTLRVLTERHGDHLWSGVIPMDTKVREASQAHRPLNRFAPHCRAAQAYDALLNDLLAQDRQTTEMALA
ncbi:MAG TPA: ParA family protein [Methylothermaceae bacterium]|nr:ParA family protein [Methylothermaceae bacterium]